MRIAGSRRGIGLFALFSLMTLLVLAGLMSQTDVLVSVLREQRALQKRLQQEDRVGRTGVRIVSVTGPDVPAQKPRFPVQVPGEAIPGGSEFDD